MDERFQRHLQLMEKTPYLIVDTEGTLTHPHSETWGLSTSAFGQAAYYPFKHGYGQNYPIEMLEILKRVIESHPCLVMHHAKHDLRALRNLGINPTGKFYCTLQMAHITDENRFSKELSTLSQSYGGQPKQMSPVMKTIVDGFGYHMVPVEEWLSYAENDAFITEELFYNLLTEFQEQDFDGELWDWDQRFTRMLMDIENTGNLIDEELCIKEYERGIKRMRELESELGFNPGSPKQLKHFLIDELGLPVLKESAKTGNPSFTKEVMQRYEEMLEARGDKRARQVLEYRGWSKTTGSNYKPYLERRSSVDNRLRTDYRQDKAKTGRLTASLLHQIPRMSAKDWNGNLKKAFIDLPGRTDWEVDYSQLEFRVGALYANEQRLLDIFNDPADRDIFTEMAKDLGMERDPTKTLNYTLQFGGGVTRVSEVFNKSMTSARGIISNYFNNYPGLQKAARYAEFIASQRGYVKYWTGRRRHFKFRDEYRKAFNALCQGGAFEIVKRQGVRVHEAGLNNDECRMDLTVHDSYRFSIENGKEHIYLPEIKTIMEDVAALAPSKLGKVKFKVEIKKWGEK